VLERCGIDTRHTPRDNTVRAPTGHAPRRNAVAFLASEQTAYITGTVMNVSGGLYTKPPGTAGVPPARARSRLPIIKRGRDALAPGCRVATLRAVDARRSRPRGNAAGYRRTRHVLRGNAAGFRHTPSPPRCNAARFRRTSITSSVQRSARLAHVLTTSVQRSARLAHVRHDLVQRSARLAHCHTTSVQRSARLAHVRHDLGAT